MTRVTRQGVDIYARRIIHIDPCRCGRFQSIQAQAKRRLNVLNAAATLDDLRNNPGARLHRLRGDRAGQWAVAVNDQYRIVFDWNDGPTNVELTDYHR